MPHNSNGNRRKPPAVKPAAATVLVLLLACLGLAACGGSSSSTSTTTASAASATTPPAPGAGRFAAIRECMAKNGVPLPQRTPGAPRCPPGVGGFLGGGAGAGPRLPAGVTRAQYEAALKKCGGGFFRRGNRLRNPAVRAAYVAFAKCMRQNGVNVPEPNTSGSGPVFSTKGLDTTSPQFKAAYAKCQPVLRSTLRPPGAGGGGGVQAG